VGLIPKSVLLDAGRYFLRKQQRSLGIPEQEIIRMAVLSMGLDDLKPFDVDNKVIEYMLDKKEEERLVDRSVTGFILETASESPAPGGGSIAAVMGALGAALGTMVANLSAHKPGWDDRWEEFSDVAVRGQELVRELLYLVDEDTRSFNKVMEAFGLPKNTAEEKQLRTEAIQEATFYATQVPFRVMKASMAVFDLAGQMAQTGNPNSVSDAGVGALAARAAVLGAWLNVRINAASIKDRNRVEDLLKEAAGMAELARQKEDAILEIVNAKI
jgi:glutamate formiminotransferase/formiminotetrahydrofolate cyclodeaminase